MGTNLSRRRPQVAPRLPDASKELPLQVSLPLPLQPDSPSDASLPHPPIDDKLGLLCRRKILQA